MSDQIISTEQAKETLGNGKKVSATGKDYSQTESNKELAIIHPDSAIADVKSLYTLMKDLYNQVLVKDIDYGIIPGTGDKPTLLLPGMEKICRALRAVPEYTEARVICDYDKPLFHYEYECQLIDAVTGISLPGGVGRGMCTSMESAFRWRQANRVCPSCGQEAIIKGKQEYGGGWLCFAKKGGCGAKFRDGDPTIEDQKTGRVENPDIFDQVNAILKRAKKRALGDAVKGAAAVSEFFTVDLEDMHSFPIPQSADVIEVEFSEPSAKLDALTAKTPPPTEKSVATNEPAVKYNLSEVMSRTAFMYDHPNHHANSIPAMIVTGEIEPGYSTETAIAKTMMHRALSKPYNMPSLKVYNALTAAMEAEGSAVPVASISQWIKDGKTIEQAWEAIVAYHENANLPPAKSAKQDALIPPGTEEGNEIPY